MYKVYGTRARFLVNSVIFLLRWIRSNKEMHNCKLQQQLTEPDDVIAGPVLEQKKLHFYNGTSVAVAGRKIS